MKRATMPKLSPSQERTARALEKTPEFQALLLMYRASRIAAQLAIDCGALGCKKGDALRDRHREFFLAHQSVYPNVSLEKLWDCFVRAEEISGEPI